MWDFHRILVRLGHVPGTTRVPAAQTRAVRIAGNPKTALTLMNELTTKTAELVRLEQEEARSEDANWKRWGPYLSERQWGTVRED